ncbi:MAG: tRNA threonylcarbamoyladenosine dehydratase, partial [Clostridia bacterium]|nr:tRNA threonylcarbamoyladenosine dehydratase [Clostridia bacterium]
GGVGGYVVEMLVRLGVEKLTIVDFDKVDISNFNRQLIATNKTVNLLKTEAFKDRILQINENCLVTAKSQKISNENIEEILTEKYDYVIDAIDDLKAKVEVAKFCKENNLKLISSMGTGNRYKFPNFEVSDISKTSYDKLAKKLRKMLKDEGVEKLTVVYTKEPVEPTGNLGSIVYYPLMCAGVITSYVTNEILKKEEKK